MLVSILQTSTGTQENRYPEVFDEARRIYPGARKILSFGCSTGEELATLAGRWPEAEISGVEILDTAREIAARNFPQHRVLKPDELGNERFDIITAMSVLCRWPEVGEALPFPLFENAVRTIDSHLNPGGMLVTFNTTYNPASVLEDYEALDFHPKLDLPPNSRSRLIVLPRNVDGSAAPVPHPVLFLKPGPSGFSGMAKNASAADEFRRREIVLNAAAARPKPDVKAVLKKRLSLDDEQIAFVVELLEKQEKFTAEAQQQVTRLQSDLAKATSTIQAMRQSRSWRVTAPLRSLRRRLGF